MERRGVSLRELHKIAQQAGVPVDLSRILRGRVPPPEQVARLAPVLLWPTEEVAQLLEVSKQYWRSDERIERLSRGTRRTRRVSEVSGDGAGCASETPEDVHGAKGASPRRSSIATATGGLVRSRSSARSAKPREAATPQVLEQEKKESQSVAPDPGEAQHLLRTVPRTPCSSADGGASAGSGFPSRAPVRDAVQRRIPGRAALQRRRTTSFLVESDARWRSRRPRARARGVREKLFRNASERSALALYQRFRKRCDRAPLTPHMKWKTRGAARRQGKPIHCHLSFSPCGGRGRRRSVCVSGRC